MTQEVTFMAEDETQCVTFEIAVDNFIERDESFGISFTVLSDPRIATPGDILMSEVTIVDRKLFIIFLILYSLTFPSLH